MSTPAQIGHIYWLPDTPESRRASFDHGKLGHPVLVLGAEKGGKVQVLGVTSFGNRTLSDRFPDPDNRLRRKYLPLKVAGALPHPDNGILLEVISQGHPPLLTKQSYVNLEPFEVEVGFLDAYPRSTCLLPVDMLKQLMAKLRELQPSFKPRQERSVATSSPSRVRRQQPVPVPVPRPQPPPATRPQPLPATRPQPLPATRPQPPPRAPVPAQQRPLLSPQRAYSSPYGTTPLPQDHGRDLEWNAPRPRYQNHYHDSQEEEPDYSVGWDILGYVGIAAAVVLSVRWLLR